MTRAGGGTGDVGEGLVRALADHPDDAWVLMGAVRDGAGSVVDFTHEWVNEAAERNAGRRLAGRTLLEAFGPGTATLLPVFRELLVSGGQHRTELVYGDHDETEAVLRSRVFSVWAVRTGPDQLACQYRDVTALRRAEERLVHQARHDELTGLPNRRLLREHLHLALSRLHRGGPGVLVLLGDLDRFKEVNDTYGHSAGDELLRMVAERLRGAVRAPDLVARYGGDEFIVMSDHVDDTTTATLVDRVRGAVAGTYRLPAGPRVRIGMAVGAAVTTAPTDVDDVLIRADRALYSDKGYGSGRLRGQGARGG